MVGLWKRHSCRIAVGNDPEQRRCHDFLAVASHATFDIPGPHKINETDALAAMARRRRAWICRNAIPLQLHPSRPRRVESSRVEWQCDQLEESRSGAWRSQVATKHGGWGWNLLQIDDSLMGDETFTRHVLLSLEGLINGDGVNIKYTVA